jgi:thiamine-monophosphate kinase
MGRSVLAGDQALLPALLTGGDDYELVFTAPEENADAIVRVAAQVGVSVGAIGRVAHRESPNSPIVRVINSDGEPLDVGIGGWRHF